MSLKRPKIATVTRIVTIIYTVHRALRLAVIMYRTIFAPLSMCQVVGSLEWMGALRRSRTSGTPAAGKHRVALRWY